MQFFCSRECRREDWKDGHKKVCTAICDARKKYAKEEEKLKHFSEYGSAPTNYFEDPNCIGHFWGLLETRDFCRALGSLAKTSYGVGNKAGCKEAIQLH